MATDKRKVKNFIAMWDNLGLECVYDVDQEIDQQEEWEKKKVWETLKGEGETIPTRASSIPLKMMIMRARANSQRHYEIYQFVTEGLDMDDIKSMFEHTPQAIVDFIRKNGKKIYSDRFESDRALIV